MISPYPEQLWAKIKPNSDGLIPCISQDLESGTVLMMAWVSEKALEHTLQTGWATFWSRSRQAIWTKGESSGNRQKVEEIRVDWDGDTLLYRVQPQGPACHLKTDTCFSEVWKENEWVWSPEIVKIITPK